MMRARRVVMGLLALGVVAGYGSAAASFARHAHWRREQMRQEVLHDVSRACADGARAERAQQHPQEQAKPVAVMLQITPMM